MSPNILVRGLSPRAQRALPIIAAAYEMRSSTEVVLWAIEAMVASVCEHDTLVAAAIDRAERSNLPERVSVAA